MMAILCQIEAAGRRFLDSLARSLGERATGFSDSEAGDFLSDLAYWHRDGGPAEWLAQTPAPPAGEQPTGAGETGPGAGAAAPPDCMVIKPRTVCGICFQPTDSCTHIARLFGRDRSAESPDRATSELLITADNLLAGYLVALSLMQAGSSVGREDASRIAAEIGELSPQLRDRAAQFEAIED